MKAAETTLKTGNNVLGRMSMASEHDEIRKRWTAKRRVALVLELLRGDTSVAEAARTHGLTVAEVEAWRERLLAGAENALRSRPADEEGQKDRAIKRLKQKGGALVMDVDILKEATKGHLRCDRCPTRDAGVADGVHSHHLPRARCRPLGLVSTPRRRTCQVTRAR